MLALRKCRGRLARANARLIATNSGDGDSKGRKKDGALDFSELFKSKAPEKKSSEPLDFKKLFSQTSSDKSQFKLDMNFSKKAGGADSDKVKLDLQKLFADSPGPRTTPGEGGMKGFKLDLSKIKNRPPEGLPPRPDTTRRDPLADKKNILANFQGALKPVPPKDHLLEKYLSVENMSLPQIQKIELEKVKREFQLHDTDCGSSAVQIAMLTKKMSFLSKHITAYKKDVPSRRSMNRMVQLRRKLMIYLRRTDFDMYCYVVHRLSLRDRLEVNNRAAQAGTKVKKDKHKLKKRRKKKRDNKYKKKPNDLR